eukprot:5248598-Pyramimonas_sp.AAC.1
MSGVEHKRPGYFLEGTRLRHSLNQPGDNDPDDHDWGFDMVTLGPEDLSYALGQMGSTRKKLAQASRCILEYLGQCAVMAGSYKERERSKSYLTWLLQQRNGPVRNPIGPTWEYTYASCVRLVRSSAAE